MYRWFVACLLCVGLLTSAFAQQSHRTMPSQNSTFITDLQTYLLREFGDRLKDQFPNGFVTSGGIHATAAGMTSAGFATVAYSSAGGYINQASQSINYTTQGCANDDDAWVITVEASTGSIGGNFTRVGSSRYATDCVSTTRPTLPAGSTWLMHVSLVGGAISIVQDLRLQYWFNPAMAVDNTHGAATLQQELHQTLGDGANAYVVSGCAPAVPSSSITLAAFACKAYVKSTAGELIYVDQPAKAVTLTTTAGTYWLMLHSDTTTAVTGWTRQVGTHYLWKTATTQPADPANGLVIAYATVASNVVATTQFLGLLSQHAAKTHRVSVLDYGADPLGIADSTTAFTNALTSTYTDIFIPQGTYVITDTLTVTKNNMRICGAGKALTILQFKPASSGKILWNFVGSAAQYYGALCDMQLVGGTSGTPYTDVPKTAIKTTRNSEFHIHDVDISFWHDSTWASYGWYIAGWELYRSHRVSIQADRPIYIDTNTVSAGTLDLDVSTFTSTYMRSTNDGAGNYSTHPCIEIKNTVAVFDTTFNGDTICAGESGGFLWDDTAGAAIAASRRVTIDGFRWEKPTSAAGGFYGIKVLRKTGGQGLGNMQFKNLTMNTAGSEGITLSGCNECVIENYQFSLSSPRIAYSGDNNDNLLFLHNTMNGVVDNGTLLKVWSLETDTVRPNTSFWVASTNTKPYVNMKGIYLPDTGTLPLKIYENSTWTPLVVSSGGCGGACAGNTYTTQLGYYVRIGRIVYVSAILAMSAVDGTMAGTLTISGLPYAASNVTSNVQSLSMGQWHDVNIQAGMTSLMPLAQGASVLLMENGDNVASAQMQAGELKSTSILHFSGTYIAAN